MTFGRQCCRPALFPGTPAPTLPYLGAMSQVGCTLGIQTHVQHSIALWNEGAGGVALAATPFSRLEQKFREAAYDAGVRSVEDELKSVPRTRDERMAQQQKLIASFGRFATTALGLEDEAVHMIADELIPVGTELARWTRRFD